MSNWSKERRTDLFLKMLLFTISPLASCLYSFKRINTRSSYLVFFLMSALFGLAFSVPNTRLAGGIDGSVYRSRFEDYIYLSEYNFKQELLQYLSFDSSTKDFYFNTVAFYTSRFTENYHVMFMIFAMVFSYFMLKSLRFLTSHKNFNYSIISYILIYLFTFNQIFNINGVRFWTAAWIATYCILQIVYKGNRKYYALALLTPFFHGAYFIFIAVLLIYSLSKRFERFWIILFIFSFVFSSFATTVLSTLVEYFEASLPSFIVNMTNSYTDSEYVQNIESNTRLLYSASQLILNTYLFSLVFLIIKNSKKTRLDKPTYDLYLFVIVWVSIFNFLLTVPSLGGRFITLSYPLIALVCLSVLECQKYKYYILILPVVFILKIYSQAILYSLVLDTSFFYSPFFLILYKYLVV